MRKLAVAVVLAVPFVGVLAPAANAVCDPDIPYVCVTECLTEVPDPKNPLAHLAHCPR